jgi:streptomycin 6-kinase
MADNSTYTQEVGDIVLKKERRYTMTIQEKKQYAISNLNLSCIETIYENDTKAVYKAGMKSKGNVILKINQNTEELRREYNMLKELNGDGCCVVYKYDLLQGVLLEEQIIPGIVLREEKDLILRINHFADVFRRIHREVNEYGKYENYVDWLDRAYDFCINNDVGLKLTKKMKKAREFGREIFEKHPERVLLHGDLHHDNMLLNSKGSYSIIDPKGIIGPSIFDLPRYIMNELHPYINKDGKEHIMRVISLIGETLDYSISDIKKLFFMEVILANIWCIEDGQEPNLKDISIATEVISELLE